MSQRYLPPILLLAAIWGASYLFIKVGVRDFEPPTLMALRLVIAFVPLFVFVAVTRGGAAAGGARGRFGVWRVGLVLGLLSAARAVHAGRLRARSTSTRASPASRRRACRSSRRCSRSASCPASARPASGIVGDRARARRRRRPDRCRPRQRLVGGRGHAARSCSRRVSYAAGGLFGQTQTRDASRARCSRRRRRSTARLVLLPWGLVELPVARRRAGSRSRRCSRSRSPGRRSRSSCSSTCCALHGAAKVSLVTYLMPPFAVFYGATILGEPLRWSALAGLGADPARRRARLRRGRCCGARADAEDGAVIEGDGVRVRRAEWEDVDFLVDLLGARRGRAVPRGRGRARPRRPPRRDRPLARRAGGVRPLRHRGRRGRRVADAPGAVGFEVRNRRSRIAFLQRLAVHPDFRGRRHRRRRRRGCSSGT